MIQFIKLEEEDLQILNNLLWCIPERIHLKVQCLEGRFKRIQQIKAKISGDGSYQGLIYETILFIRGSVISEDQLLVINQFEVCKLWPEKNAAICKLKRRTK